MKLCFIELREDDRPIFINLVHVMEVRPLINGGCSIAFVGGGDSFHATHRAVTESYAAVVGLIRARMEGE